MERSRRKCSKDHTPMWSGTSSSESEDESTAFAEDKADYALLILYNVCCRPQEVLREKERRRVELLLKDFYHPRHIISKLKSSSVIDLCCVGASTKAGMRNGAWNSKVGTITIALIKGEDMPCKKEVYHSNSVSKLENYCPSSFSIWAFSRFSREALHNKSLQALSGQKVCLAKFLGLFSYNEDLCYRLKRITLTHTEGLYKASKGRDERKGIFKQHVDTNIAIGQTIQRILNFVCWRGKNDAPLEICPCHIGRSDSEEWASMHDPCKKKINSTAEMLNSCCTCGRMTFKIHTDKNDKGIGDKIKMEFWKSVLLHNLKDSIIQNCLGGCIEHAFEGQVINIRNDSAKTTQSRFVLLQERHMPNEVGKMLNHLIFIFNLNRVEAMLGDALIRNSQGEKKIDASVILEKVPLRNLVQCGEFHLAGRWVGENKRILLLQKPSNIDGRAGLLIGGYVGPQLYAIENILQRREEIPTRAMRKMLSKHMTDNDRKKFENNSGRAPMSFLDTMTASDIQKELGNTLLTEEQKAVCSNLDKRCFIDAVAGSGKSTIGAGILLAGLRKIKLKQDGRKQKCVWLTPTRTQRDDALAAVRKLLQNQLTAVAIGRQLNTSLTGIDDFFLDAQTEAHFKGELSKYYDTLENIKLQQNNNDSEGVNNFEWDLRKNLANEHAQNQFQLEKAQAAMLMEIFENVDIVFMTVDGFNQLMSGMSSLSRIFDDTEVVLGVLDEVHQVEVHILLSALSSIEEAVCFYDQAQKIDRTNDDDFRSKGHGGFSLMKENSTDCFHWDRCVGLEENQKTYIWDIVDADCVSSLPVSFRFNHVVCKFLRLTSNAYKTPNGDHHPNCGIYSASEMQGFDDKTKNVVPNTKIQIAIYAQHLFNPIDKTNVLLAECALITARMKNSKAVKNCYYVGCSIPMLAAMVHEGLVFLSLLQNGKITSFASKEFPCLTMIYLNAPREVFGVVVNSVLQDSKICEKYGVDCISNPDSIWKVLTPDTGSGMNVSFAQLILLPRQMCYADTKGNLKDDGRKNVGCTRARLFLSIHVCEECLLSEESSDTWAQFAKLVLNKREDNEFRSNIINAQLFHEEEDKFDTKIADWLLEPSLDAGRNYVFNYVKASTKLWHKVSNLPEKYESFKNCYDGQSHEKATRADRSQTLLDQFLAIVEGSNRRQNEIEDICMQGITDDVMWIPAKDFVEKIEKQFEHSEKLRPYLLPYAPVTFDENRCSMKQYMLYSIDQTIEDSWLCAHTIASLFLRISWELFGEEEDQYIVKDTNASLRIATRGIGSDPPKMEFFIRMETTQKRCLTDMYTMIFEKISTKIMDRLAAATLFYTRNRIVRKDMFRFVHNPRIGRSKIKKRSSEAEIEAQESVTAVLSKLHKKYDVETLSLQCGEPSPKVQRTSHSSSAMQQHLAAAASSSSVTVRPANPGLGVQNAIPRTLNLPRNIGIDIAGVLVSHRQDWDKSYAQWHTTTRSEVPDAVDGVQSLVHIFGAKHVFMVSYAESESMRDEFNNWLDVIDFSSKTGFLRKNVFFTSRKYGVNGKGPLARDLNLTYFVDDNAQNLQSIYRDPKGNNGTNIDKYNGRLFYFPRSGNFRHKPPRPWNGDFVPACLEQVDNWIDVIRRIQCLMA